jgi:hypothetical protein
MNGERPTLRSGSVSFTIPASALPADFDPKKPLAIRAFAPLAPAFDPTGYGALYSPPKDPDDPDSGGGLDPEDPDALTPNPNGGGGSGALSGTGSLTDRLNAIENAINFAEIEAECNEDTTITVTLTWGVPPPP